MFKTRTWLYKLLAAFVLVIGLSFSLGGFIMSHSQGVVSTKIGASIQNGAESLVFQKANFYQKSNLLEVALVYHGSLNNANEQLQITVYNGVTKSKISAQLQQINLNYYVVFVPNISSLKQVLIEFATTSINTKGEQTLQTSSITPKNSQMKGSFVAQPMSFYEAQYVSDLSSDAANQITGIDQEIKDLQAQITQFEDANNRLKTQLSYQTKDEQAQTQQEMGNNNSQITSLKGQIQAKETSKKSLEDKLNMLKNK